MVQTRLQAYKQCEEGCSAEGFSSFGEQAGSKRKATARTSTSRKPKASRQESLPRLPSSVLDHIGRFVFASWSQADDGPLFALLEKFEDVATLRKLEKLAMAVIESIHFNQAEQIISQYDEKEEKWNELEEERHISSFSISHQVREHVLSERERQQTKSYACKAWILNDKDLEPLPVELKENRHRRSFAPMQLYSKGDLFDKAMKKHGSIEKLVITKAKNKKAVEKRFETMKCKRKEHQTMREEKRQLLNTTLGNYGLPIRSHYSLYEDFIEGMSRLTAEQVAHRISEYVEKEKQEHIRRDERKQYLIGKLKEHGLSLRSDSRLCEEFIAGDSEFSADDIADVMSEMHWLHQSPHSTYRKWMADYMRDDRQLFGVGERSEEKLQDAKEKMSELAKEEAVREFVQKASARGLSPLELDPALPEKIQTRIQMLQQTE